MAQRTLAVWLTGLLGFALVLQSGCAGCKDDPDPVDDDSAVGDDDVVEEFYRGMWASMEITADGEFVVAFYDSMGGGMGLARSQDPGAGFSREQVDGYTYTTDAGLPINPGDRGQYLDLELDSAGTPHISYFDRDATSLMYTTFNGDMWTNLTVDGTSGSSDVGSFTSLVLDGSGNPAISYYDIKEGALKFAIFDGGWSDETVDEGELLQDGIALELDEANVGQYTHMVLQDDVYWIAYYDVANGNLKLAHGTPGSWIIETLAGDGDGDRGAWPFLYPLENGVFLVSFHDVGAQDLLVGRYEGGVLPYAIVDDGEFVGADSVIAEIGGGIRIHYFDGVGNDVKQAVDNGDDTWTITTLLSDGALGFSNNLAAHDGKMAVCSFNYTAHDFQLDLIDP